MRRDPDTVSNGGRVINAIAERRRAALLQVRTATGTADL
jgi:hypothetical protein